MAWILLSQRILISCLHFSHSSCQFAASIISLSRFLQSIVFLVIFACSSSFVTTWAYALVQTSVSSIVSNSTCISIQSTSKCTNIGYIYIYIYITWASSICTITNLDSLAGTPNTTTTFAILKRRHCYAFSSWLHLFCCVPDTCFTLIMSVH